jgi:hypothetical protein
MENTNFKHKLQNLEDRGERILNLGYYLDGSR